MKKYFLFIPVIIVAVIFIFLYFNYKNSNSGVENGTVTFIDRLCIQKCKEALASKSNLENGPCLLNPISEYPNWVCDVAHSPRIPADDLPENQCSAFREGKSSHFIEVSENCQVVRSY